MKYVEDKMKTKSALLFIISWILILAWFNNNILIDLVLDPFKRLLIALVFCYIGVKIFQSRIFLVRHEYDAEINEETRQVNIIGYKKKGFD